MNATAEILKYQIERLSPELLENLARMVENMEIRNNSSVPQFQLDEILSRIQFHKENPKTKLDFYENISELEKSYA